MQTSGESVRTETQVRIVRKEDGDTSVRTSRHRFFSLGIIKKQLIICILPKTGLRVCQNKNSVALWARNHTNLTKSHKSRS